jgi:hypothetical protein
MHSSCHRQLEVDVSPCDLRRRALLAYVAAGRLVLAYVRHRGSVLWRIGELLGRLRLLPIS